MTRNDIMFIIFLATFCVIFPGLIAVREYFRCEHVTEVPNVGNVHD